MDKRTKKGSGRITNLFNSSSQKEGGQAQNTRRREHPVVNHNHGGIMVTGDSDVTIINIGDTGKADAGEESALSTSKLQMHRMLQELRSLTSTLRDLVRQLRRLAPSSAWSQQIHALIDQVESRITNHLSRAPIWTSSICRAIFGPPSPPCPQLIEVTTYPDKSPKILSYPAFNNLSVGA